MIALWKLKRISLCDMITYNVNHKKHFEIRNHEYVFHILLIINYACQIMN